MDHGPAVRIIESVRDLVKPSLHDIGRKLSLVPAHLTQGAPGKVSHNEVEESLVPAVVVNVDKVGMTEPSDGAGLPEKALLELGADHQTRREHFYSDSPGELVMS